MCEPSTMFREGIHNAFCIVDFPHLLNVLTSFVPAFPYRSKFYSSKKMNMRAFQCIFGYKKFLIIN
jgi:hypothetical protein